MAVVGIAIAVIRASSRLEKALDEIASLSVQVRRVTDEAQDVLGTFRKAIQPVRQVADRLGELGERTARLAASIVDEVEAPVRAAVAITRGIRSGTSHFVDRLNYRFRQGRHATDGGFQNE